jgi:hypothetical protein
MVRFEPRSFDDEQKALQATEYVNWVMNRDNDGVSLMHTWFKDALLQKNGILKVYWDETVNVTKEKYQNLNEQELTMLLSDDSIEVKNQEQIEVDSYQDPMTGAIIPMFSYNVTVKKTNKTGQVVIENVPPEEFIISKKARTVNDSPFVAHRRLITRSELISMGYSKKIVEDFDSFFKGFGWFSCFFRIVEEEIIFYVDQQCRSGRGQLEAFCNIFLRRDI